SARRFVSTMVPMPQDSGTAFAVSGGYGTGACLAANTARDLRHATGKAQECMMDSQSFDTPSERAALDITRLRTVRLVPPEVAGNIARRRVELATTHDLEAARLRQLADAEMTSFERVSGTAFAQLDEWLSLQRLTVRTFAQESRHQA